MGRKGRRSQTKYTTSSIHDEHGGPSGLNAGSAYKSGPSKDLISLNVWAGDTSSSSKGLLTGVPFLDSLPKGLSILRAYTVFPTRNTSLHDILSAVLL